MATATLPEIRKLTELAKYANFNNFLVCSGAKMRNSGIFRKDLQNEYYLHLARKRNIHLDHIHLDQCPIATFNESFGSSDYAHIRALN